ncbi:putative defense protein [Pomacea canaliculata]|uniref:putative defense protein n=1 Tax=Pomacea canaliculata TaxID=400727 RepID=UPI000D72B11A|nr:putative defense protein [Pomacea canaliculata]
MKQRLAVVAVLLATLGSLSRGYQNGAPKDACVSMFPRHQAEAQTSPSPYNIILNTATYTPGSNNTVAVLLTSPQQTFAGVLVEARSAADCGNTNPIGTFLLATNERDLQLLSCMAAGDAVTQKSSLLKATSKVFLWHPPVQSSGPVYFRATVVKS